MNTPIRLIYGTGNPAKLQSMRRGTATLDIEILSPKDIGRPLPHVEESGGSPLENARIKAREYYSAFRMPVFSCDSGLYFDGLPKEIQPGIHVREIGGRRLTDDEMISRYASLAERYGDLTARWRNAICLVLDEETECSSMDDDLASQPFIITSKPHPHRREGFPLDSLSIDIATGKYYYDLARQMVDSSVIEVGCVRFFQHALKEFL